MNTLDGPEDFLDSDKLFVLIGNKMVKFRNDLMLSKLVKTLKEVTLKIIPQKEINLRGNTE